MKTKLYITFIALMTLTACNVVTTEDTLEENMEKSIMDKPVIEETAENNMEKIIDEETDTGITEDEMISFTLEEVGLHNSQEDCWTVINEKVYDVTSFITQHNPSILMGCGIDGTGLFENRPNSGTPHPEQAVENLNNFLIGELK